LLSKDNRCWEPPLAGDEAAAVLGSLERQRAIFAWKWQLMTLWQDAVGRSRRLVADALADGGLDHVGRYVTKKGESPNLRRILHDMIEEYARHIGHADLIRESVDGLVGEDPPD
jgi:Protein of unknown function (DUF664)